VAATPLLFVVDGVNDEVSFEVRCSRVGVTRETGKRWLEGQMITVWAADRYAVGMGLHPCEVWGDAWWDLAR
jgi:hypothetical protein